MKVTGQSLRLGLANLCLGLASLVLVSPCTFAVELRIATVNNGHMIKMAELSKEFESQHPDIKLKWVTLDEGTLRQRVMTDIASNGGQYDVMTIGMYETPIWAKRDWLLPLQPDAGYEVDDLLPAIQDGLSFDDKLYAAPFYGESSMLMYRKDVVEAAGFDFNSRPTWDKVYQVAEKVHAPDKGLYGICLRGKPGWGDNITIVGTMLNSFGGRWFDENWQPQMEAQSWKNALTFYQDILTKFGPPHPENNSFNENLALMKEGKCAMWVDATIAASFISNPSQTKFADKMAFAQAPYAITEKGANWLWAWALAIPKTSRSPEAAQKFVLWATSKDYIQLVAKKSGWATVPTGTRYSTYESPDFKRAAKFAEAEFEAIQTANPHDSTLMPVPYVGVQFAAIPEFTSVGNYAGAQATKVLSGETSIDKALLRMQKYSEREMKKAGYVQQDVCVNY